jgi:parallel beta-helix repeat protein
LAGPKAYGEIRKNYMAGSNAAGIYVGNDQNVNLFDNIVTDNVAGIEIEISLESIVSGNHVTGDTAGILSFVLPGLPQPFTDTVLIEDNYIADNNRTNTGDGTVGIAPKGSGVLILGVDNLTIRNNEITGNDSFGNSFDSDFPTGIVSAFPSP